MRGRRLSFIMITAALCALLSGCVFRGIDDLYAIPQPSAEYRALQERLDEVIAAGGEYAAPVSGDLIQSVQLQDLDGDGKQEAIAFFRFPGEEKPLKVYIFQARQETYQTMAVIEGAGTAIDCVEYVQMDDQPYKEVLICWQLSAQLRDLGVYSVGPVQVEELVRTDYDSYKVYDLDRDDQQELVVFRTLPGSRPWAELYDFDGVLTMTGTAPISTGAFLSADGAVRSDYITSLRTGYLSDRVPALFATSAYREDGAITDIFISAEGKLKNITMDPATGESGETIRSFTAATVRDVNGDGIVEVPQPIPLPGLERSYSDTVSFWLVRWRQFDSSGSAQQLFTTYYNDRDGWYFILPDGWEEQLILTRSDLTAEGERAVRFSWLEETGETAPFLTVYKLTGTNREARSKRGERFIISNDGTTIYAAELQDGWSSGLDQDEVEERFGVITTDWYNG